MINNLQKIDFLYCIKISNMLYLFLDKGKLFERKGRKAMGLRD